MSSTNKTIFNQTIVPLAWHDLLKKAKITALDNFVALYLAIALWYKTEVFTAAGTSKNVSLRLKLSILDDIRSLRRPSEKLDFWRESRFSDEVILEN
jgi:hypothetical protein